MISIQSFRVAVFAVLAEHLHLSAPQRQRHRFPTWSLRLSCDGWRLRGDRAIGGTAAFPWICCSPTSRPINSRRPWRKRISRSDRNGRSTPTSQHRNEVGADRYRPRELSALRSAGCKQVAASGYTAEQVDEVYITPHARRSRRRIDDRRQDGLSERDRACG